MTRLEELAKKYGTDKLDHGYMPFYEKYLPINPKRILEIGVKDGASIRMWREWFGKDVYIHGLDLFAEKGFPEEDGLGCNTIWHKGDQRDWKILEELRKYDFDVIIDDGSHNSRDQMMTFYGLFNGKQYYIEDLHCCEESSYRDGLPYPVTAKNIAHVFNSSHYINVKADKNIILIQS